MKAATKKTSLAAVAAAAVGAAAVAVAVAGASVGVVVGLGGRPPPSAARCHPGAIPWHSPAVEEEIVDGPGHKADGVARFTPRALRAVLKRHPLPAALESLFPPLLHIEHTSLQRVEREDHDTRDALHDAEDKRRGSGVVPGAASSAASGVASIAASVAASEVCLRVRVGVGATCAKPRVVLASLSATRDTSEIASSSLSICPSYRCARVPAADMPGTE